MKEVSLMKLPYSSGPVSPARAAKLANSSSSNRRAERFDVVGMIRNGSRDLFDSARVGLATPISTRLHPPKMRNPGTQTGRL